MVITFAKIADFSPLSLRSRPALLAIDRRISCLHSARAAKPYERQKCKLHLELESFLSSLPTPKSPISASPKDLIRFLIWKDSKWKTKIHVPNCPNFGSHSKWKCSCPSRLAAVTVDSTIGKLRSIFNSLGRSGMWSGLSPGNPAAHPSVKEYLASISKEQAKARVSPRQAVPFFFDKFSKLCYYLRKQTFLPSISPLERYIVSRDLAFLCLDFYSGDRASDLGRVFTKEVLLLSGKQGLLFHHKFGKRFEERTSISLLLRNALMTA